MDTELAKFLKKDGAIQILCVLSEKGLSRQEIIDNVLITDKTVDSRIERGKELQLWEAKASTGQGRSNLDFVLTQHGDRVRAVLMHYRLPQIFTELRTKQRDFDRKRDRVVDNIADVGVDELFGRFFE